MSLDKKGGRDLHLDLIRGLAALLVCMGHLRAASFVDLADVGGAGGLTKGLYLLTSLGHQSVMVFFVLSGYLVGGSVISAGERFNFNAYGRARLARLWTVLLPCLALTWCVDQIILRVAPDVLMGDYAALWHSAPVRGHYDLSLVTLLGNVFFVQTLFVPVFGSNGPLWSLASEFWYYALFPSLYLLLRPGTSGVSIRQRVVHALVVLVIFCLMTAEMRVGLCVWLCGAVVAYRRAKSALTPPQSWLGGVSMGVVVLCAAAFSKWSVSAGFALWGNLVLGVAVALMLHRMLGLSRPAWPQSIAKGVQRLSDISFSLYLSHFPVVILMGSIFYREQRTQPSPIAWTIFVVSLSGLLGLAHVMWWLFERRTDQVRGWLRFPRSRLAAR